MNPERISFAEKLDEWARRHFDIDAIVTDVVHLNRIGTLECRHEDACSLYLRLWQPSFGDIDGHWPANTLVIASIEFANTRAGHGRALLEFLVRQSEAHGYERIAIEHAHDGDSIQGFAKKFGFGHAWPKREHPHRNWIAPIARIAEHLGQVVPSTKSEALGEPANSL